MTRSLGLATLTLLFLPAVLPNPQVPRGIGAGAMSSQMSTDETSIRAARAQSNAAIAKHDVAGIAAHWMPDVHIVTSTSAQVAHCCGSAYCAKRPS